MRLVKSRLWSVLFSVLLFAGMIQSASAGIIVPTSYSVDIAPNGSYPDSGGVELTDGIDGSLPWNSAVTPGVGWQRVDPIITFNFSQSTTLNKISIEFQGNGAGGIFLPTNVLINSDNFAVANNTSHIVDYLDFTGSWTGTSVDVKLFYRNEWIFVDEVKFEEASAAPEPATLALLGLGLAGIGFSRRKAA